MFSDLPISSLNQHVSMSLAIRAYLSRHFRVHEFFFNCCFEPFRLIRVP